MSRIAALLVVACACAPTLTVQAWECTVVPERTPSPDNFDYMIPVSTRKIGRGNRNAEISIQDYCKTTQGGLMMGVRVEACDDVAPDLAVPDQYPFSPAVLRRTGALRNSATLDILTYCVYVK